MMKCYADRYSFEIQEKDDDSFYLLRRPLPGDELCQEFILITPDELEERINKVWDDCVKLSGRRYLNFKEYLKSEDYSK